jgi:hypothetical protein
MNTLWFTFALSRVEQGRGSQGLIDGFLAAHAAADTEYAVIHPYDHWSAFEDRHYRVPVTINLMFRGVFWANFLGHGHIEEFDLTKLQDLDAHLVRPVDGRGLFVVATPDVTSVDTPESEAVLLRLTQRFREALRADSRWR